jgi:hypothetical protein
MNVCSGTLIDIELKRDEFTAAIEPPFRKGNHEFATGEGATDLFDVEGGGSTAKSEATNDLRMGKRQQNSIRTQRQSPALSS